jgi:enterochelin esterase-like enzyme
MTPHHRRIVTAFTVFAASAVILATAALSAAKPRPGATMHASQTLNSDDLPLATGTPALTTCNGPAVGADDSVTFCVNAPQATQVVLQLQSLTQKAPTGVPYPMAKDANGIWSVTVGPFDPSWYGYAFTVDGVQLADPANRNVALFQAPPIWPGPSSAWSWVMVPGPAADYMAQTNGPHGTVSTVYYYSKVLQSQEQMLVYTPPGYNRDHRSYPVFYLYPGGGGMDTDWTVNMRANFIMDNLIAAHHARPMIIAMPEYNLRNCPNFGTDLFPQQLTQDVIPTMERNFRVLPGSRNRALAGLSSGAGCVINTLVADPAAFSYFGAFSPNWPASTVITQNYQGLLNNPAINRDVKLFWITKGGPSDIVTTQLPNYLAIFDQYHINYTYDPGTNYGATFGHVWDTWRKALENFAPLLFDEHDKAGHGTREHSQHKHGDNKHDRPTRQRERT